MTESPPTTSSFSRHFLDGLLPEELEWERLVRTYPLTSLAVAAVGGYFLGRRGGALILEAVSQSATERVSGLVGEVLGESER
jgi:hypothetical protein